MKHSSENLHPLRVFVVENHPATLKTYQLYLKTRGHVVCHATSVAEALVAIPESRCDVLISDVGLPDGTGWDLVRQLKARGLPHPPFAIAVSGYGTIADRAESSDAGFRYHLTKPFNLDDLDAMLEEATHQLMTHE